MRRIYQNIICIFSGIRLIPHWILFYTHEKKRIIHYDTIRWLKIKHIDNGKDIGFIKLMTFNPEFRNLYYKRIGYFSKLISFLCPQMSTLYIYTKNIGPGLYIEHGFATIIAARSIGKDCSINQQVTVGYSNDTDCPTIFDNVTITAGAKIIGDVILGNNSVVGANAVVVKNVPQNCTVVGVPANIIKRNGIKVKEKL